MPVVARFELEGTYYSRFLKLRLMLAILAVPVGDAREFDGHSGRICTSSEI